MVSVELEDILISLKTTYERKDKIWNTYVIVGEETSAPITHENPLYRTDGTKDKARNTEIFNNLKFFIHSVKSEAKIGAIKDAEIGLRNRVFNHKQDIDKLAIAPPLTCEEIIEKMEENDMRFRAIEAEEAAKRERVSDNIDQHTSFDGAGATRYLGCYLPEGYVVDNRGVGFMQKVQDPEDPEKTIKVRIPICDAKFTVTGYFEDADTKIDIVELTYVGHNAVESIYTPSVALLGSQEWKKYVRKNDNGRLAVPDEDIKGASKYCRDVVKVNIGAHKGVDGTTFKTGASSSRTGWEGNKFERFIIGSTLYCFKNGKLCVEPARFMDIKGIDVDTKLQPKGTLQGWINAVNPVMMHHRLRFLMYYAFATILLGPNDSSNNEFNVKGETSTGKTFTLMVQASMFGNPSLKSGLLIPGDTSLTALNANVTTLCDIPMYIDEIGEMKDEVKDSFVYMIGNGKESMRGKQDGTLRETRMIRSNVISSGEVSAVSEFANNGVNARNSSTKVRPIPDMNSMFVDDIKRRLNGNYGHILPLVLAKFFELGIDGMINLYKTSQERLYLTTEDPIMRRKTDYYALAEVGGILLERVFRDIGIMGMDPKHVVDMMWNECVIGSPDIPLAVKALSAIRGWVDKNPRNFLLGDAMPDDKHPDTIFGWLVISKDSRNIEFIDFNTEALKSFLRESKYGEPNKTLEYFRAHNITACTKSEANGSLDADGVKRLMTYSTPHRYQYGQPAVSKPIIRIRMDKIKELLDSNGVEEIETKPIMGGLSQLAKPTPVEMSAETYIDFTDPEYNFFD